MITTVTVSHVTQGVGDTRAGVWSAGRTRPKPAPIVPARTSEGKCAPDSMRATPTTLDPFARPSCKRMTPVRDMARRESNGRSTGTRFIAEGKGTRVELEHRRLDRYGERREEMRRIFDTEGDWGKLLEMFAGALPVET
jgi:hypothetical protein